MVKYNNIMAGINSHWHKRDSALALAGLARAAGEVVRTRVREGTVVGTHLVPQLQVLLPQLAWETGTWVTYGWFDQNHNEERQITRTAIIGL
jgi:hypothetical protein